MATIDLGPRGELERLARRALSVNQQRLAEEARPYLPRGFSRVDLEGPTHPGILRGNQLAPLTRAIRRQTAALVVLAVMVGLLLGAFLAAPGANSVVPAIPTGAPTVVELSVFGPGPAAEVISHIAYVDGTESEQAPGTYRVGGLAGAQMQIMSADVENPAGCRIVIDGVIVAEAVAELGGYHAVCRWEAP